MSLRKTADLIAQRAGHENIEALIEAERGDLSVADLSRHLADKHGLVVSRNTLMIWSNPE